MCGPPARRHDTDAERVCMCRWHAWRPHHVPPLTPLASWESACPGSAHGPSPEEHFTGELLSAPPSKFPGPVPVRVGFVFLKNRMCCCVKSVRAFLIGSRLSLDHYWPIWGQHRAESLREAREDGGSGQSMFVQSSGPHGCLASLLLVRVGEWMRVLRHQPALGNEKKLQSPFLALGKAWPVFSTGKLKVKVLKQPK